MSSGTGAAVVRVVKVLLAYALGAAVAWSLIPPIRRTFLLPALFTDVAQGALVLGAFVAALVAWRYPGMGVGSGSDQGGGEG